MVNFAYNSHFNIFPVQIFKFLPSQFDSQPNKTVHKLFAVPTMGKYCDYDFCLFTFGGYQIYIKVDDRPIDLNDKKYFLNDEYFKIDKIDFDSSRESKDIKDRLDQFKDRLPKFRRPKQFNKGE